MPPWRRVSSGVEERVGEPEGELGPASSGAEQAEGDRLVARAALQELLGVLHDLGRSSWTADAVEMAVLLYEADGRVVAAAQLLGASRALRKASGSPLEGNTSLAGRLRACREHLGRDLGLEVLTEHEAAGAAMSVRDVLAFALEGLDNP